MHHNNIPVHRKMLQNIFSTKNNAEFKSALAHLYFNKELFKVLIEKDAIYEMYWEKEYHTFSSIYTLYIYMYLYSKSKFIFFPSTDFEHAIISITYVLKFTQ